MVPVSGPRQQPRCLVSIAIIFSSAVSACSASHDDEVKSAAVSFASAAAGGNMALHQWLDGNLPAHFAERALAGASENAASQIEALITALIQARQDPAWPMQRLAAVLAALGSADDGLARSDREAVAASVRRLDALLPAAARGQ
jgi:citrate synthase